MESSFFCGLSAGMSFFAAATGVIPQLSRVSNERLSKATTRLGSLGISTVPELSSIEMVSPDAFSSPEVPDPHALMVRVSAAAVASAAVSRRSFISSPDDLTCK